MGSDNTRLSTADREMTYAASETPRTTRSHVASCAVLYSSLSLTGHEYSKTDDKVDRQEIS